MTSSGAFALITTVCVLVVGLLALLLGNCAWKLWVRRNKAPRPSVHSKITAGGLDSYLSNTKTAAKEPRRALFNQKAGRRATAREVFGRFDRNGDGSISRKECANVFKAMGISAKDAADAQLYDMIDESGDGEVSFEEFELFYLKLAMMDSPSKKVKAPSKPLFLSRKLE